MSIFSILPHFPIITGLELSGQKVILTGEFDVETEAETYTVEFFLNDQCDASGHGEGKIQLGSVDVTSGIVGKGVFSFEVAVTGPVFAATLTDPSGNTSEFSACAQALTVNSANDVADGSCDAQHCSLRDAINKANSSQGAATVSFNIAGQAQPTITLSNPLPTIAKPVTIDATTQPGGAGLVRVNGTGIKGNGFHITSGRTTLKGLWIRFFEGNGVLIETQGDNKIVGNTITGNTGVGIRATSIAGNLFSQNSIFDNGGMGIDTGPEGVNEERPGAPNDPGALRETPLITNVSRGAATTTFRGTLRSSPDSSYTIEFFSNAGCDQSQFGEGERYIGSVEVITDVAGFARFDITLPAPGRLFSATASGPRSTSEFSPCVPFVQLVGLEVIQVIQDWDNSVPLIADKPTVARVFIEAKEQNELPFGVKGFDEILVGARLRGFSAGKELSGSPLTAANSDRIDAKGKTLVRRAKQPLGDVLLPRLDSYIVAETSISIDRQDRDAVRGFHLFRLPNLWLTGDLQLYLDGINEGIDCRESAGMDNDCRVEVTFVTTGVPKIKLFLAVRTEERKLYPTDAVADLIRLFPITKVSLSGPAKIVVDHREVLLAHSPYPRGVNLVIADLERLRQQDKCFTVAGCNTLYVGLLETPYKSPDFGGAPDSVPGTVASGVRNDFGRNSHLQAQMVAGLLGRHLAVDTSAGLEDGNKKGWCGESAPTAAPDFPYVSEIKLRKYFTIGPMDQGPNRVIRGIHIGSHLGGEILGPSRHFAMMSYCGLEIFDDEAPDVGTGNFTEEWISKHTYEALFAAIRTRYPSSAQTSVRTHGSPQQASPVDYIVFSGLVDLTNDTVELDPIGAFFQRGAARPAAAGRLPSSDQGQRRFGPAGSVFRAEPPRRGRGFRLLPDILAQESGGSQRGDSQSGRGVDLDGCICQSTCCPGDVPERRRVAGGRRRRSPVDGGGPRWGCSHLHGPVQPGQRGDVADPGDRLAGEEHERGTRGAGPDRRRPVAHQGQRRLSGD